MTAFQIGGEVSPNELRAHIRIDVKTVGRYLGLLEKRFVIRRLEDRNATNHGALFENFVPLERTRKPTCEDFYGIFYFWRTYDDREIDLVGEINGKRAGFELKLAVDSDQPSAKRPFPSLTELLNPGFCVQATNQRAGGRFNLS